VIISAHTHHTHDNLSSMVVDSSQKREKMLELWRKNQSSLEDLSSLSSNPRQKTTQKKVITKITFLFTIIEGVLG